MSYLIIIGIILLAIGSFVTYLGSKKDNDESQQVLIDKINAFRVELNNAQNDQTNESDKVSKINEITNEFDSWATSLKENLSEIKLSYNKSELEFSEKELKLNKEWRSFYLDIFKNIESMVLSINKNLDKKNKIIITKPVPFPTSLFRNEEQEYNLIIKFDEYNFWIVSLYRFYMKHNNSNLPNIEISFEDSVENLENLVPQNFMALIIVKDSVGYEKKGIFKHIDVTKFSQKLNIDNINEILKDCMQFQIVRLEN